MPGRLTSKRPPAPRGEEWKAGRRAELLAASDRVIRRVGPAVSMDDMATEAGVSRVVLYRYFGDKGGLYQALAERYIGALMARLREALTETDDPRARLRRTIEAYVSFIETNREAYAFLVHRAVREGSGAQDTVADFMRSVATEVGEVLGREIASFGFDPAPAESWAHGVVGMVQLSTDHWITTRAVPRATFVNQLVALLSFGFFGLAGDPELAEGTGLKRLDI